MRSILFVLIFCGAVFMNGCGGSASSASNGTVNLVSITPNPVNLVPTQSIQLTAILDGGTAPVTWSINTANGGTITQGGVYTAPSTPGDYEIQVAVTTNPSKFGTTIAKVK
jgi:hypothetical protein